VLKHQIGLSPNAAVGSLGPTAAIKSSKLSQKCDLGNLSLYNLETHIVAKQRFLRNDSPKQILKTNSPSDKQLYIANCCHQSHANPCRQVLDIAQKVPNCTQCIASNEPTICHLHSRNQTSSLFTASALCHAVCSNHGRNAMQLVQSIGVRPCRFPMTTVYTTPFLNGTCKWADISALNLNQLPNASCSVKRFHQTMHHHWQGSSA